MIARRPPLRTKTRFLRNLSALMIVRGLNLIAPVIAIPYILRTVGLENYGHVAFATVVATFAGSIIQYGFSFTGVKAIGLVRHDHELLAQTFWRNFLASLLIGLGISAAHGALTLNAPYFSEMMTLHLGAILLASGNALFPHWLFLGMERSYYVAISTLAVRVLYLFLLLLFVREPADFFLINLLGAAAAWLNIAFALLVIIVVFDLRPVRTDIAKILQTIRDGFPAFLLQWTPNLYNTASAMILGFHVSPAVLGAFNAANAVVTLIISLGQLLANAFLPILATSFAHHRISAAIIMGTGLLVTLLVFLLAPICAMVLSDTAQDIIIRDLHYLALSVPFAFGYYAYGYNYVALTEGRKLAGKMTLFISLGGLVLAFILVPPLGSAGVAAVLLTARACLFLMSYTIYRRQSRMPRS